MWNLAASLAATARSTDLSDPTPIMLTALVAGGAGIALGCWLASRRVLARSNQRWGARVRSLVEKMSAIRRGEAAIEELATLDSTNISPLIDCVRETLHDLKSQRSEVAAIEAEMRQRVANRTDALERALSSLRYQATRDPLTGLFNRRFLDQYLPQAVERHHAEKADLCLLMIDVDNFKVLNDTLGHAAGDELLKSIGQIIRSTTRGEDVGFRCGGDEFVVLIPSCGPDAGQVMAERLGSLVDALAKTIRVPAPPRLSIGLACLSDITEPTPQALLESADKALYTIKDARKSTRLPRGHADRPPMPPTKPAVATR